MKNDYSSLDNLFSPTAFVLPPIPCGKYIVTDDFNDTHQFNFRRMPRARRYTGRYGLFYHDPDAHWQLVGYINDQGTFEFPREQPNDLKCRLSLFLLGRRKVAIHACAWCGRTIPTLGTEREEELPRIHDKEACTKNLRHT